MFCARTLRHFSISARKASSTSAVPLSRRAPLGVLVERAFEYRLFREERGDLVPPFFVLVAGDIEDAADACLVVLVRLLPAVVDRELRKVREDGKRQLCRPGIAPELEGRARIVLDVNRGLLGLDEELAHAADPEGVIRRLGRGADLHGVLVDDLLVRFGIALPVGDIPAEGVEERIEKFTSELGFVVAGGGVGVALILETLNKGAERGGRAWSVAILKGLMNKENRRWQQKR